MPLLRLVRLIRSMRVYISLAHLHIYRPLHPDGRRRHDGRRAQVDQHVSQLLLDVTVIHSWYCGRAVCWNIRTAKEQDFFNCLPPLPPLMV